MERESLFWKRKCVEKYFFKILITSPRSLKIGIAEPQNHRDWKEMQEIIKSNLLLNQVPYTVMITSFSR